MRDSIDGKDLMDDEGSIEVGDLIDGEDFDGRRRRSTGEDLMDDRGMMNGKGSADGSSLEVDMGYFWTESDCFLSATLLHPYPRHF